MRKIRIICKTSKGRTALEHHVAETIKIERKTKITFKLLGYEQEIILQEPYTLEIRLNNKHFQHLVRSEDILRKINEALGENGALKDRDYIFEVEE